MTKIQWTDKSWNPIIGCTPISEGCKKCYAEKMAYRLLSMELKNSSLERKYFNVILPFGGWEGNTHFVQSALEKPFKWKKPRMIFVCSMGDLFHKSVSFNWFDKVFSIIQKCPQHTFQILTKRPEIMKSYFESRGIKHPYLNVWLGVTAENQKQANKRIPILLEIPSAKRFVSCEPLLSSIDLTNLKCGISLEMNCLDGSAYSMGEEYHGGTKLDWVIAGPETGSKARPMKKEWIKSLHDQCKAVKVPFFDKKDTLGLNIKQFPNDIKD